MMEMSDLCYFTKTSNALVFTNFYAMAIFGRKCSHVYFSEDNSICDPEITDKCGILPGGYLQQE